MPQTYPCTSVTAMYLLYICFDDSLVVYTVNLRVQNKLGINLKDTWYAWQVFYKFYKGDKLSDFLIALLHIKPFLKWGLL